MSDGSSSMSPLQSSSRPLHSSPIGGFTGHAYSHPSPDCRFRSRNPASQAPATQPPSTQLAFMHAAAQRPQFCPSFVKSNPSSVAPSQSLSCPSHASFPLFDGQHEYSQPFPASASTS